MESGGGTRLEDALNLVRLAGWQIRGQDKVIHLNCMQVGTGWFQVHVLVTCGLANAADAVEILSVGLLGTAAGDIMRLALGPMCDDALTAHPESTEEELGLTPRRIGILNACIFLGMLVGGLLWGILGDIMGRRWSLIAALLLNALFGALSASSQSLATLVTLRLVAGLGVGGSVPIVFTAMSEFCTAFSR